MEYTGFRFYTGGSGAGSGEARKLKRTKLSASEAHWIAVKLRAYHERNAAILADWQGWIRERRKGLGVSQRILAEEAGVSAATISFWERGYVRCDKQRLLDAFERIEKEKGKRGEAT